VSTSEVADALSEFPGLATITVYGVKVPGHDGRAGMVAVVLEPGVAFDPRAFWQRATRRLPSYAVPLFVRIPSRADMTGNYKLRKVDLQREGYDPATVKDPLFVRDDASESYVPFSDAALRKALRG
jgi:fatty-acyl-CoA synthase